MLLNPGGRPHSEECRNRVIQWMASSDNPKYRDRLEQWINKVEHYFDVCGDAYNSVTLTDFTESKNVSHPEPTSPAVQLSPEPEKTPRAEDPAEESNASASLKVKTRFIVKLKKGTVATWKENKARRQSAQESTEAMETSEPAPSGAAQSSSSSALKRSAEPSLDFDDEETTSKFQALGTCRSAEDFMKGYIGFFSSGRDAVPELEREND